MRNLIASVLTLFYFWVDPDTKATWIVDDPKFLPSKAKTEDIHQMNYDGLSGYDKYTRGEWKQSNPSKTDN